VFDTVVSAGIKAYPPSLSSTAAPNSSTSHEKPYRNQLFIMKTTLRLLSCLLAVVLQALHYGV
jgi:hypothetical protein